MKKQHDPVTLANELEGSSAFFQPPRQPVEPTEVTAPLPAPEMPPEPEQPADREPATGNGRSDGRPPDRSLDQPASRPVQKRQTQRRAFEFYRDQVETFRQWAATEISLGGEGNMSRWAREAFDAYIATRNGTSQPGNRSTDRPSGRLEDRAKVPAQEQREEQARPIHTASASHRSRGNDENTRT